MKNTAHQPFNPKRNPKRPVKGMPSPQKLWAYLHGTILHPTPTLKQLASEPSLTYSFTAYLIFGSPT